MSQWRMIVQHSTFLANSIPFISNVLALNGFVSPMFCFTDTTCRPGAGHSEERMIRFRFAVLSKSRFLLWRIIVVF
jgi:hypothetical protein